MRCTGTTSTKEGCSSKSQPELAVAIKSFAPQVTDPSFDPGAASITARLRHFQVELTVLQMASHPNIVRILAEGSDFFALELIPNSLFSLIKAQGKISQDKASRLLNDLVLGVNALYSAGWCHMDIKPCNALIKGDSTAVLCDFGCCQLHENGRRKIRGWLGTEAFSAPEVSDTISYRPKPCDVWSLACVFFTCVNGGPPFENTRECPYYCMVADGHWESFWQIHQFHSGVVFSMESKERFQRLLGPGRKQRPEVSILASELGELQECEKTRARAGAALPPQGL